MQIVQTAPTAPYITAFLTAAGIDLVLRDAERNHRCRVSYVEMTGVLAGQPIQIEIGEADDQLTVVCGKTEIVLKLQPKGHFFGWIKPIDRSEPITLEQARLLRTQALMQNLRSA